MVSDRGKPRVTAVAAASRGRPPARDPAALLLAEGLTPEDVRALLAPYGVTDVRRADENLQAMAGEPRSRERLAGILGELLHAISRTADPDQALNAWERFLQAGLNRSQLFGYLSDSPRMLEVLCSVFGNSPALTQTLVRDPILVYWLAEQQVLTRRPSRAALSRDLAAMLANLRTEALKLDALRRFKRREMLRIGVRDLLQLADVRETIAVLSDLACVLIRAAYEIVETSLRRRYGMPSHRDRTGRPVGTGFAIVALGKLGGGELNFSSDVDLIYVYGSDEGGTAGGPGRSHVAHGALTNEELFEVLARELTKALGEVTQEGSLFRVDLRLRAEGTTGRLARSLEDYRRYYRSRGQPWERMALLKAWPVAGSIAVGRAFLRMARGFIRGGEAPVTATRAGFAGGARQSLLEQVKAIKAMIDEKMAKRGLERRHVKLGFGGIREIEFVVQSLQVLFGSALPGLFDRSTLGALERFRRGRLLSARQHAELAESYLFLRNVEHKLQLVHDLQTHALPEYEQELARCAIRLGYARKSSRRAGTERFLEDYAAHTARVHRIFEDLIGSPDRSRLLRAVRKRVCPAARSAAPQAPGGRGAPPAKWVRPKR